MAVTLRIEDPPVEPKRLAAPKDSSSYPLKQLLQERHKVFTDRDHKRFRWVEYEIQRRCANLHQRTAGDTATGAGKRYRPYGLILGAVALLLSSGPFVAVELSSALGITSDPNGDSALLTGAWAVITVPFAAGIYLIGAIMDAERIVKRLNL